MVRSCRFCIPGFVLILIILAALLLAGPASLQAQEEGATQGEVALNLARLLAMDLPEGATADDAIDALTAAGIAPAEGWDAAARTDSAFVASLYSSVEAAVAEGKVSPGVLGSAAAVTAAAAAEAGMARSVVVAAIVDAGGDAGDATVGATAGGTYGDAPAPGALGGIGDTGPEAARGGGGGGSPSPSR